MKLQISGTIIPGEKIGRTIGFPTANLQITSTIKKQIKKLKPGVYSGHCQIRNHSQIDTQKKFDCLVYFGPRLIFSELKNSFEVYIVDFDQDIYDCIMEIKIGKFIREPIKFKNTQQLQLQLKKDLALIENPQLVFDQ